MTDFYQTGMGKRFYTTDLPNLINAIDELAKQLEKRNLLEERKYKLNEKLKNLKVKETNEKNKQF